MGRKVLAVAALFALALAAASAAAEEDILGPIGPIPAPEPDHRPTKKVVAVSLAVGFGVLSVYLTRRRRRRRRAHAQAPRPVAAPPADDLLDLPDGDLYAELLRASKALLRGRGAAAAMTPAELSGLEVPQCGDCDWAGFCARIEEVLYAAGKAGQEQRQADLRLVQGLAVQPEARGDGD